MRQQVAAVCYRIGTRGIEFLLVRTRGGRWIFPKGGVEAGLTQAQSAALEAFEEAGVHGRIEEMPFARYRLAKTASQKSTGRKLLLNKPKQLRDAPRAADAETVTAHLCEVSHLEAPQETYRTPTWFSAEKAKRRLTENRDHELGGEMASVVDRAVSRIRRLDASSGKEFQSDALRKVRFEAFEDSHLPRTGYAAALVQRLLAESRRHRPVSALEIEATPVTLRRKKNYVQ